MSPEKNSTSTALSAKGNSVIVRPVVNAVRIIRLLSESGAAERAVDIARKLSINPSTCFNILRTLLTEEMVTFDEIGKTYSIGPGIARLARHQIVQQRSAELARQIMQEFAARYRVTVSIWHYISPDRIEVTSLETAPKGLRIEIPMGHRVPVLMGASGRLFAKNLGASEDCLRKMYQEIRWARPLSLETYLEQVMEADRRGWAVDDGYFSAGIMTIAAPVNEPSGKIAFTVSAVFFRGQYTGKKIDEIGTAVRDLAQSLQGLPL